MKTFYTKKKIFLVNVTSWLTKWKVFAPIEYCCILTPLCEVVKNLQRVQKVEDGKGCIIKVVLFWVPFGCAFTVASSLKPLFP